VTCEGVKTILWFVSKYPDHPREGTALRWDLHGLGVGGDSGAPVVDWKTNKLIGQVWGQGYEPGSNLRIAFFTPAMDIFDEVQELYPELGRPELFPNDPSGCNISDHTMFEDQGSSRTPSYRLHAESLRRSVSKGSARTYADDSATSQPKTDFTPPKKLPDGQLSLADGMHRTSLSPT
jgi:hypothetical protein